MKFNNVEIDETYAEAFGIQVSRVLITAATEYYAKVAATEATGFGTSVIGCPAEAGIDCFVPAEKTPDGRPGYAIMICHPSKDKLKEQLIERIGECVLTAPTDRRGLQLAALSRSWRTRRWRSAWTSSCTSLATSSSPKLWWAAVTYGPSPS